MHSHHLNCVLLDTGSGCASPLSIDGVAFGGCTWSTSRIPTVQVGQTVLDHYKKNMNTAPIPLISDDPNSIKIRIPIAHQRAGNDVGEPTPVVSHTEAPAVSAQSANTAKLTIRIPAPSTCDSDLRNEDEPDTDEEIAVGRRTFCPLEHRDTIVEMMERHLCAHPLIPGYSAPTPEGIKAWAVKQSYEFCVLHDLPNLWAYLWENWYRRRRWELWARSANPMEIPRLKTTMFVEGQ